MYLLLVHCAQPMFLLVFSPELECLLPGRPEVPVSFGKLQLKVVDMLLCFRLERFCRLSVGLRLLRLAVQTLHLPSLLGDFLLRRRELRLDIEAEQPLVLSCGVRRLNLCLRLSHG